MRLAQSQRGQLLVAGVVLIVVVALMVVALGFLYVSSERSSSLHNQSAAAYAAAYSGIEVAKYQFSTGTACNLLTNAQPVGSGQFSTTGAPYPTAFAATLASGIPAGSVSSVPLTFTSGSLTNLAPHGEITIGTESIDYGSTSATGSACSPAPCLGGIVRGANGTTAAAHSAGAAVTQANQCVIRSTGILGSATRILESTVQASSIGASNFGSGANPLPASGTVTIASVTSSLPVGDNYIIAVVTFGNATGNITTIPTGNLKLTATTAPAGTLAQTTAAIWVGGSPASGNKFPQEAQVLIGKHSSASGTPTYSVTLDTTGAVNVTSASATAQILVINGIASANASLVPAVPGAPAILTPIATATTTLVTSGPVSAGNNVIIAQVQLDNTATTSSGGRRNINQGNLTISRGATVLMSNQFAITLDKQAFANEGSGYLLMTVDNGAAAGTTYTVTALADAVGINGSASILVFNGFAAAVTPTTPPPGSVSFGTVGFALGSVPTTFPAGENVVLAAIQYENTSGGSRNIAAGAAGNETITLNGARVTLPTTSANAYNWNLCSGSVECDDYFTGLLWRQTAATATANPTFGVQSQADVNPSMTGAANVLAISLSGGVRRINTIEVYP